MDDRIKALAAQRRRIESKEVALIEEDVVLEAKLLEEFGVAGVHGASHTVVFEYDEGEPVSYGWLAYAFGKLRVGYRTYEEDDASERGEQRNEDRPSPFLSLKECSTEWLKCLMTHQVIGTLLDDIGARLSKMEGSLDATLATLRATTASESAELNDRMTASLEATDDARLSQLWSEAVDATHSETADGLTRSCRFLEAVCATILRARGATLPRDKSLTPLIDACVACLPWPDAGALTDAKQLFAGVKSIAGGIGTLRTHFGTAHGATSHLAPPNASYALLAKNAAASVAIFLLSRHSSSAGAPLHAPKDA